MALGKWLVQIGVWIETHFPAKINAAEVEQRIAAIENEVGNVSRLVEDIKKVYFTRLELQSEQIAALEKVSQSFTSDINKTKLMLLNQRQTTGR
jgi:hypothetical protein